MSLEAASAPTTSLISEIFAQAAPRRAFSMLGWGIALAAHVVAAGLAVKEHRTVPRPPPPLEVELAPPPAPPPVPVPVVTPPPIEERTERIPVAKAAAAAPPEPARAAALLTAKEDPAPTPNADEPVDFTNDPNAVGFGSGVVAVGGKALVGQANARPHSGPPSTGIGGSAPKGNGDALTPVANLSQKPSLNERDPCRGYFPATAQDDVASASVMVTIGKSGAVSNVQLLSESPPKQGFGAAARTCMASKRFSPGLDRDGKPAATAVRVNIRFMR
jgi:outer membrane biosynthesis protein TonB